MITNTMSTIVGTRLPSEPVMAYAHVAKPWQGLAILGGFRDDNSTGVSAHGRRHE
jgi:hypothetical protein